MRGVLLAVGLLACGGPNRQLASTPVATTPLAPSLAPPASDSDEDRYRLNQSFEDMSDGQQAHREAKAERGKAPPPPLPPDPWQAGSNEPARPTLPGTKKKN